MRATKNQPGAGELLLRRAPDLIRDDAGIKEDLATVFRELGLPNESVQALQLPAEAGDKQALTAETMAAVAAWQPGDVQRHAQLGAQVFQRSNCVKCHTTATQTTLLAPSLQGIGSQKMAYLVESILLPSQVIKTGFESSTIVTKDGRTVSGLVKEAGDNWRVLNFESDVLVPKSAVEERTVQRVSIMPEGQERTLSRRELADLIAYLTMLK